MSLYVYCLGEQLPADAFEGMVGVSGARVRLMSFGRLAAVVSEACGEAPAVNEENLLAHNRVNAAALSHTTPLPFRFGTRAARERIEEYVSTNEAALFTTLARVRGCVEMGVKLLEKAEGGGPKPEAKSEESPQRAQSPAALPETAAGRGTAFLLKKRRELLGEEEARRRAQESAAWLCAGVAGLARETAERLSPSEAIIVRAAHLVGRGSVAEYRARLRALAAERTALRLLTSGPWPPYSFSDLGESGESRI